jgi:hypothetical protein
VLVTDDTALDGLPVEGEPLKIADLNELLAEIAEHQQRITEAVRAYKTRTRSKTLTEPTFPDAPAQADFAPHEESASQRAFALANFARRIWSTWLDTDAERLKRTVQPKTGASPWVMPAEMNEQSIPDFPPTFAARIVEQPLV